MRVVLVCTLLWLVGVCAMAQTPTFDVQYRVQSSRCIATPQITVTITNSTFPEDSQYQYTLYNRTTGQKDGSPGRTPLKSWTFRNLTAGTYDIDVTVLASTSSTKEIKGIVIVDPYQPTVVEMDLVRSRNASFPCGTGGALHFNITNGAGTFKVKVVSGPMHVGDVIPYTKVGENLYKLEGENWKPGNYRIEVSDSCDYIATEDFTITELNTIPTYEGSVDKANSRIATTCNTLRFLHRAFPDGDDKINMYFAEASKWFEVGVKYPWMSDSEVTWKPMEATPVFNSTSQKYSYTYSYTEEPPKTFYEMFEQYINSSGTSASVPITTMIRLKACGSTITKSNTTGLSFTPEILMLNAETSCTDGLTLELKEGSNTPYCNAWMEIFDDTDGGKSLGRVGTNNKVAVGFPKTMFTDGSTLRVVLTDANGRTKTETITVTPQWDLRAYNDEGPCGFVGYHETINFRLVVRKGGNYKEPALNCPKSGRVIDTSTGRVVSQFSGVNVIPTIYGLSYGTRYEYEVSIDGTTLKKTGVLSTAEPTGVSYDNRLSFEILHSVHDPNKTLMRIYRGNGSFKEGSVLTVKFPDGRVVTKTFTAGSSVRSGYRFDESILGGTKTYPPGTYEAEFYNACDGSRTKATYNHVSSYIPVNFHYDIEFGCGTAIVRPYADVYLNGQKLATSKYKFFIHPQGTKVDQKLVSQGEPINVTGDGEYVLSVVVESQAYNFYKQYLNNSGDDYRLFDIPLEYTRPPLVIDPERSLSYVCGSDAVGQIWLQAKNGVPPYTYELYTDDGLTIPAMKNGQPVLERGVTSAHFEYGRKGEELYVKVTDKCGNSFKYAINLVNVTDISAAYAAPDKVCEGDGTELRFIGPQALKDLITATWYNPQGAIISNGRSDVALTNMTPAMAGRYRVEFILPGCGARVTNYVNLKVTPRFAVTDAPVHELSPCVGAPVSIEGMTTTIPDVKSQWELAKREVPDFEAMLMGVMDAYTYTWGTGLVGETNQRVYSNRFVKPGTYVLRHVFINNGCNMESTPIFVRVKHCTVPLNPNLMHHALVDWNVFNHIPTKMIN